MIQRQRRLSRLPLKQDPIQQLSQPGQRAETAAIAQIHKRLGANRLEIGAAGDVRMGHEGRSAGHGHQGGAGSRTRKAGLARSLSPPPLLPHGFEHGLDLPQAGIPEAATEQGLRGSLIWAGGPWGHMGMDRHVVNMQLLRRN